MARRVPATNVVERVRSVATNHAWSSGHQITGRPSVEDSRLRKHRCRGGGDRDGGQLGGEFPLGEISPLHRGGELLVYAGRADQRLHGGRLDGSALEHVALTTARQIHVSRGRGVVAAERSFRVAEPASRRRERFGAEELDERSPLGDRQGRASSGGGSGGAGRAADCGELHLAVGDAPVACGELAPPKGPRSKRGGRRVRTPRSRAAPGR
jgi:hypothetical protein